MNKEWKQLWIENYGYIQVSNFGEVLNNKGRLLKPKVKQKDKYLYIRVHFDNYREKMLKKQKYMFQQTIHRLVALLFIPNPNNYPEVNHIDGNKKHNSTDNLEWVTHIENVLHSHRIGLCGSKKGSKNGRSKLSEKDIPLIFEMKENGCSIAEIARVFNVGWTTVSHVLKKETWSK